MSLPVGSFIVKRPSNTTKQDAYGQGPVIHLPCQVLGYNYVHVFPLAVVICSLPVCWLAFAKVDGYFFRARFTVRKLTVRRLTLRFKLTVQNRSQWPILEPARESAMELEAAMGTST